MTWTFNFKKVISIVLSALMLTQVLSNWVFAFTIWEETFPTQTRENRAPTITVESTMTWFFWDLSQEFFADLGNLVWEDMTKQWLVWFNTLMSDGSILDSALFWISRSLIPPRRRKEEVSSLSPERQALVAMSEIVSQWKMTVDALRSIKDMFDDNKISPVWLTRLTSLYRQYNITIEEEIVETYYLRCDEDEHTISRYNWTVGKISTEEICEFWCNDEPRCLTQEEIEEDENEAGYRISEDLSGKIDTLRCEDGNVVSYDWWSPKCSQKKCVILEQLCTMWCEDWKCLTQQDVEKVKEVEEVDYYSCDGITLSRYDSKYDDPFRSYTCEFWCYDSQRCRMKSESSDWNGYWELSGVGQIMPYFLLIPMKNISRIFWEDW
jgi:hypothetical protein